MAFFYRIRRSLSPSSNFLSLSLLSTTTSASSTAATAYWNLLRSNSSLPNLEQTLSRSKTKIDASTVASILRSSSSSSASDRHLALRFFVWAGLQPHHRHSAAAYAAASDSLRLPLHPQALHQLLDCYQSDHSPVSVKTFKILLNLCRHSHLPDQALSLLRRMPDFGCRPDTSSYNAVLRLLASGSGHGATILTLIDEMALCGLRPDMVTYVSAVKGLCADSRLEDARGLLTRMRANGCEPNVVVYSALLDGACACGDLSAAMGLLGEMEGEKMDGRCAPNVVTYTCLMKCLCEKGQLEEALGVLDRMGRWGCFPNRVTVGTLLKGFCGEGHVDRAYELIEKVVGEGSVSSEECYSLLVVCLLRVENRMAAEGLLGRMLARGIKPDGLACNSLLRVFCEKRLFLDGYRWFVEMEKVSACIDLDVYSCLLAGLCEEGHLGEAVMLGRKVVERGVPVEVGIMDRVVEALEKIGEGNLASQIMSLIES